MKRSRRQPLVMMLLRACARAVRGAQLPPASAGGLHSRHTRQRIPAASHIWRPVIPYRPYGTGKSAADEIIDEITEQFVLKSYAGCNC